MAEKKFFVDINLQGSALTNAKIGTNTGIGSTEGAFGYDSSAHRLQYFDGTATKDVANLSDIAAVTGGLIFQGGYDPTTNTPDITDGSALKGFFWAVTAAGTFLGESVQVGDSIVAKVDNAGTTLSDWLILQGNIVVATDSVDGISRLATQTEANDGTEAGAVVITPATLQGKIDAQITPAINSKLPLDGSQAMQGNLNLDSYDITNVQKIKANILSSKDGESAISLFNQLNANGQSIYGLPAPTDDTEAANKLYVDNVSNDKLPLAGGTMSGSINMNGSQLQNSLLADATLDSNLDANGLNITNLATPTNGGDATNKTYVDGQVATALPLTGGTMTGNIDFLGPHGITNLNAIQVDNLSATDPSYNIVVYNNLDLQSGATLTNVPAPTNGVDATNKTYVDGVGATAVNDANEYTDTAISAQSAHVTIQTADWTLDSNNVYYFSFAHNLNSSYPLIQVMDSGRQTIEMLTQANSQDEVIVYSNILPSSEIELTVMKAK